MTTITRRDLIRAAGVGAAVWAATGGVGSSQEGKPTKERWKLSLNSSTISPASLDDKVSAAAKAGYDAIELWAGDLDKYEKEGRSLTDLGKRIKDLGLGVVNVIGLWNAMPAKEEEKAKTDEGIRLKLAHAQKVGSKHIAALPTPDRADMDVLWAAKRYREIIEMAKDFGIVPAVEFVGFYKGIHTLGQAAGVAIESDSPNACIVCDTFHLYRGGSTFTGVALLGASAFAVCHFNDVPKEPAQFELKDADRIYPGDGILPLPQLLRDLWKTGFRGPLSLEIFNRAEWKKDPFEVARIGLDKMRRVIAASGVGVA
jgi:sugar phosphate isomerase/epimerase